MRRSPLAVAAAQGLPIRSLARRSFALRDPCCLGATALDLTPQLQIPDAGALQAAGVPSSDEREPTGRAEREE